MNSLNYPHKTGLALFNEDIGRGHKVFFGNINKRTIIKMNLTSKNVQSVQIKSLPTIFIG